MSDDSRGTLADEVAEWTPPWQRPTVADTPPDEPVTEADEYAGSLAEQRADQPGDRTDAAEPEPADEPSITPQPVPDSVDLGAVLEAILMVVDEPVGEIMLAQTLDRPINEITTTLRRLAAEYSGDGRGFDLRRQAGGWRFYTRDEYAPYVERFALDGQQVRLTKAALETLAVIAYRQPVTRGRISAIRGVNCDGVIRTLTTRGLIEECGTDPDSSANLYRTTSLFLEKMGLNSVSELPALAPFLPTDLAEIEEGDER